LTPTDSRPSTTWQRSVITNGVSSSRAVPTKVSPSPYADVTMRWTGSVSV
jgi:hypothetical protein